MFNNMGISTCVIFEKKTILNNSTKIWKIHVKIIGDRAYEKNLIISYHIFEHSNYNQNIWFESVNM